VLLPLTSLHRRLFGRSLVSFSMVLFLVVGVLALSLSTAGLLGAAGLIVDRAGAGTLGRGCLEFGTAAKGVPTLRPTRRNRHECTFCSRACFAGTESALSKVCSRVLACVVAPRSWRYSLGGQRLLVCLGHILQHLHYRPAQVTPPHLNHQQNPIRAWRQRTWNVQLWVSSTSA